MNSKLFQRASPWPQATGQECVFILDARNRVERELLSGWVNHYQPQMRPPAPMVYLKLSNSRRAIDASALLDVLNLPGETRLVPLRVAWRPAAEALESGPRLRDLLMGDPRRPRPRKARRLLATEPDRVHLLVGRSATLAELRARFLAQHIQPQNAAEPALAAFIARQAALVLGNAERHLQGSRYKVPRHVAAILRNSPAFLQDVEQLSRHSGKPKQQLLEEADDYMQEMISLPSTFWLDLYAKLNAFVLRLGYEDQVVVDPKAIEALRTVVRDNPTLLLWTHKTYLDGAVVPKVMYDNDFPAPHMFGGANMSFAGLGFLLRRAGGIFIRRSFQDNELYKLTLRHYIGLLMEKGFPLNWSFEGTRSRLGKLMPPRYGLLKYVLEACYASDARNIHIVPLTISYDLIRDVEEYAGEQTGRQKSPESLSWFIGYIRSLAKPMGKVYMDIGEPVVLGTAPEPNDKLALAKIAFQVAVEANRVTPITFPSLVTTCLLGAAPRALTQQQLVQGLQVLLGYAERRELRISPDFDRNYVEDIDSLLENMIAEGVVSRFDEGYDVLYGIAPEQHPVASYYRNTIIHFFLNKAIIELALLKASDLRNGDATEVFWQEVEALRDLFKFEFFYPPSGEFKQEIMDELAQFEPSWETQLTRGPDAILALLKSMQPVLAHATLLNYVEAYSVVASMLTKLPAAESLEQKACIEMALKHGHQAYLQRWISSKASIGKLLFSNAFTLMEQRQLTAAGGPEMLEKRKAMAREFGALVRRLDRIKAIAISTASQEWI
ncbi:glycerol-3-phosphate 1-O-acyltransferase [Pseudomaricurvus alcaniphilus]|uniref:glycerol-3-phosphate 1-O-acyltransferase n=1 Tax=Pseudomaricurvus alcaniphilus TaxID=1166482 RepID=UPI00140D7841|nr:glycerol-3-phosphate 1-O-acyltransferase [Pseudomaricurvus alcaniphilus]NHN38399.1 glycerol-3-phosphate 1-O-acyltransferase [Pseudomaricurvus alcaniphilus]